MLRTGAPFTGAELERVKEFLTDGGMAYEADISYTAAILDDEQRIVATGSLAGEVLKCILVSPARRGEGLTERLITALTGEALRRGIQHLFLYTRPENYSMFSSLGFYEIARTDHVLLLENTSGGIRRFVAALPQPPAGKRVGAVVCNCDPFTLGHQYLIERAAQDSDVLYVFVLSEEKSAFPAAARLELVRAGTAHLPNVWVSPGGPYLISSATFPDYFLKEAQRGHVGEIHCELDLHLFYTYYALLLGITARYVGSEPYCEMTALYNRRLRSYLQARGVAVVEYSRYRAGGAAVSASQVRSLLRHGQTADAEALLPPSTRAFLHTAAGRSTLKRLMDAASAPP